MSTLPSAHKKQAETELNSEKSISNLLKVIALVIILGGWYKNPTP